MHNVIKIINLLRGGVTGLEENPITLKLGGYMPLHIEYIGEGPDNLPAVAVSHTYLQNGDLMRDPEICFQWVDIPAVGATPVRSARRFRHLQGVPIPPGRWRCNVRCARR